MAAIAAIARPSLAGTELATIVARTITAIATAIATAIFRGRPR